MLLRTGQLAPDFDVVDSRGTRLKLSEFRGKKNVVLYFYPKDFTLICTAESCGFRDMYSDLTRADTEVIGVSLDTDDSHRRFAKEHNLPFSLVSDRDKQLTRMYGAISTIRSLLGRAMRLTYVIDKTGTVVGVFEGELSSRKHLDGVKVLVAELSKPAAAPASLSKAGAPAPRGPRGT